MLSIYYFILFTFCSIKFLKPERIVKHPVCDWLQSFKTCHF